MRALLRRLRLTIAILVTCAATALPSCASMGGGGMKSMLSAPPSVAEQDVAI